MGGILNLETRGVDCACKNPKRSNIVVRIYVHSLEMAILGCVCVWVCVCMLCVCVCVCVCVCAHHEECVEIDLSLCSMPPIYYG